MKGVPLDLGPEHEEAFESLKQLTINVLILGFFISGHETKVKTDTSCNTMEGIILQKQEEGAWKPVGYFSKTMTLVEYVYRIQNWELLAVVNTLQHYELELFGTKCFVIMDYQALVYWSSKHLL
jgi:hypothetical protein